MKFALYLLTLCLVLWMGGSTPIDAKKQTVNRPTVGQFGAREIRSLPDEVKSQRSGVRGLLRRNTDALEAQVTKGTYVCGNKICKLKPGVEPKGCNGICQYPVGFDTIFKD